MYRDCVFVNLNYNYFRFQKSANQLGLQAGRRQAELKVRAVKVRAVKVRAVKVRAIKMWKIKI